MEKINKHMKGQKSNPAEDFRLSKEAKFISPTLEEIYWENPNSQRGKYMEYYDLGPLEARREYSEGN